MATLLIIGPTCKRLEYISHRLLRKYDILHTTKFSNSCMRISLADACI